MGTISANSINLAIEAIVSSKIREFPYSHSVCVEKVQGYGITSSVYIRKIRAALVNKGVLCQTATTGRYEWVEDEAKAKAEDEAQANDEAKAKEEEKVEEEARQKEAEDEAKAKEEEKAEKAEEEARQKEAEGETKAKEAEGETKAKIKEVGLPNPYLSQRLKIQSLKKAKFLRIVLHDDHVIEMIIDYISSSSSCEDYEKILFSLQKAIQRYCSGRAFIEGGESEIEKDLIKKIGLVNNGWRYVDLNVLEGSANTLLLGNFVDFDLDEKLVQAEAEAEVAEVAEEEALKGAGLAGYLNYKMKLSRKKKEARLSASFENDLNASLHRERLPTGEIVSHRKPFSKPLIPEERAFLLDEERKEAFELRKYRGKVEVGTINSPVNNNEADDSDVIELRKFHDKNLIDAGGESKKMLIKALTYFLVVILCFILGYVFIALFVPSSVETEEYVNEYTEFKKPINPNNFEVEDGYVTTKLGQSSEDNEKK